MGDRLDVRYFPLVLDVVDHGVFTVDPKGSITSFNRAAEAITGYSEQDVVGRQCSEVFRTSLCDSICPLRRSIASRARVRNREVRIHAKDGRLIPISLSTAPLETAAGDLLGGVEVFRDMSHIHALMRRIDNHYKFEDILSRNPEMHRIFKLLPPVAESRSTILITGESGTGKELLAKAIHSHGSARRRPFVAVNCAAIPETLLESELFGYRKGAFTDAVRDKPGRIAQAEGGTLFLDEVGDLSRTLQVKLLRFLQERIYEPLGSTTARKANVRVIAATHRNLSAMVEEGVFRRDLYFRLNVMEIPLPPLRERSEDIPLLTQHFIRRFREVTGKPIDGISPRALAALMRYDFPGNIRELENLIERAFILCEGAEIDTDCLPSNLWPQESEYSGRSEAPAGHLNLLNRRAIEAVLGRHNGNRTRAARELGIHRTTLIRRLKKYGSKGR